MNYNEKEKKKEKNMRKKKNFLTRVKLPKTQLLSHKPTSNQLLYIIREGHASTQQPS